MGIEVVDPEYESGTFHTRSTGERRFDARPFDDGRRPRAGGPEVLIFDLHTGLGAQVNTVSPLAATSTRSTVRPPSDSIGLCFEVRPMMTYSGGRTDADRTAKTKFETELHDAVSRACEADVVLDSAYTVRTPERAKPDYTIEISEIVTPIDWPG